MERKPPEGKIHQPRDSLGREAAAPEITRDGVSDAAEAGFGGIDAGVGGRAPRFPPRRSSHWRARWAFLILLVGVLAGAPHRAAAADFHQLIADFAAFEEE